MYSELDSRGMLVVDCSECTRGGNGNDPDKCSAGWRHKKPNKGSCFSGTLIEKYQAELSVAKNGGFNHGKSQRQFH
jgi:hypothetical protein